MGKLDKSVEELTTLLDTFYNEVDGWVELAEIYYLCNQCGFRPRDLLPNSYEFQTQLRTTGTLTRVASSTPKPILCTRVRRDRVRKWRFTSCGQNVPHGG